MKLNDNEAMLLSSGVWLGVGASMLSIGLSIQIIPDVKISSYSGIYGIILGIIFIIIAIYSRKQYNQ